MKKSNLINKIFYLLLIALCFFFVTCKGSSGSSDDDDDDDDDYNNPNTNATRAPVFSNASGLYPSQFNLTITALEGYEIWYSIDGSDPAPNKAGSTLYADPITVQDRNGQANVLATTENITKMYMNPSDTNRGEPPTPFYPTVDIKKATVIRAVAVSPAGASSEIVTKTYFIGNNLSDYGSNKVLSIVTDPENLLNNQTGIYVNGGPNKRWGETGNDYNFRMKGRDWERPVYLEIFDGNATSRTVPISTRAGIRVRGGWSRAMGQKSFSVYLREEYVKGGTDIKNIKNYVLIPGAVKADGVTPVETYKNFILRDGGNDCEYTKLLDVFIQDLLKNRSFSTQAATPCIVYINGEYWGPYNLQEKYSDNHTEYKYGVDKSNVLSYDGGEVDDGDPAVVQSLYDSLMTAGTQDMSNATNYTAFCNLMDIQNFAEYWAAEIYIYNEDWPQNNYRLWRTQTAEAGNPYGDTKWRWEMLDTEFSMGIYNSGRLTGQADLDAFAKILNGEYKEHKNNKMFKALLASPDFCKLFVNTMLDLYNVDFNLNAFDSKLTEYSNIYSPLMTGYYERWGQPSGWNTVFNDNVNRTRKYLNDIRDAMVYNYLPNYFGGYSDIANILSGQNLCNVTLSVSGASNVTIKINSVTPTIAGSWTGKYYSGIPITVTASPAPSGYEFEGWAIAGGTPTSSTTLTTTITINGDMQIVAKYKQAGSTITPTTSITLNNSTFSISTGGTFNLTATVAPNNATYKTVLWSSNNPGVASVDSSGKVTAVSGGSANITASTADGKSATCAVTVSPVVTGVTLDVGSTLGLGIGISVKLNAAITPANAPNQRTTWTSSNTNVATVTADGTVTAKTAGSTNITVKTVDGNQTATCTVSVAAATTVLDLASILTGQTTGVISDKDDFNTMFSGKLLPGSDVTNAAKYEIIQEGSVKKLQFIEYAGGCPGLDLLDDVISFHVGDVIEIKGTFEKINPLCNGVILNLNNSGWEQLQGWGCWSVGKFEKTFILTQEDLTGNGDDKHGLKSNYPVGIRIRSSGVDENQSWLNSYPNGIGKVTIEQVKIYGYRP